jgi:lipid A disaccharide synthetase
VSYVGHPLAYVPPPEISRREFAEEHGLDPAKEWIALLPGSRRKEVRLNLPVMLQATSLLQNQLLQSDYEFVLPVASTLSHEWVREQMALMASKNTSAAKAGISTGSSRRPEGLLHPVTEGGKEVQGGPEVLLHPVTEGGKEYAQAQGLKPNSNDDLNANSLRSPSPEGEGWDRSSTETHSQNTMSGRSSTEKNSAQSESTDSSPAPSLSNEGTEQSFTIHLTDNARAAMLHARASVVASGTATVEAALSGTPFVVVYRLAPLTWILGRRLVKLDTFAMPNLIAGKKIVPELIQSGFTVETVVRELNAIIPDGPTRQQMLDALKNVQSQLQDQQSAGGQAETPIMRASREIMAALQ